MSDRPVILFVFAGRRANLDLQIPLVQHILDTTPNAEYHVCNFARNKSDAMHIRALEGPGIVIQDRFYRRRFRDAYAYYTQPQYQDALFVKIDDDVVFLETERFDDFTDAIEAHPGTVLSANTVNNGASTRTDPQLWELFTALDTPLLDVHKSPEYAALSHEYFIHNASQIVDQPITFTPTQDWLSINAVGFDHNTLCAIEQRLGKRPPPDIAGRAFTHHDRIGDEGAANMLPRIIMGGFTAAHLGYGPQRLTPDQLDNWRQQYQAIGRAYLQGTLSAPRPEDSTVEWPAEQLQPDPC